MGMLMRQTKAELRQLPLMLAKLLGGIAAVIGFTATVVILSRKPGPVLENILPSLFLGCTGIVIFSLSARGLPGGSSTPREDAPIPAHRTAINLLSWGLLLLSAGIFLACTHFLTRR